MSTRTRRDPAAKAALADISNESTPTTPKTQAKSKTPKEKNLTPKSLAREENARSKSRISMVAGSSSLEDPGVTIKQSDKPGVEGENVQALASGGNKRKRQVLSEIKQAQDEEELEDLPHNLGRVKRGKKSNADDKYKPRAKSSAVVHASPQASVKKEVKVEEEKPKLVEAHDEPKKRASKKTTPQKKNTKADTATPASETKVKTPSKKDTYGITEGISPFPNYPHPTPDECYKVADILRKAHPHCRPRPKTIPEPSQIIAGCGEVPSVLDAMIRTLLSAATNGRNSSNAYQGMVKRYGNRKTGVGKGSVDYNAVRLASQADLEKAIAIGGLAKNKSKNIKAILDMVYEENQQRRKELLAAKTDDKDEKSTATDQGLQESEEQKNAEITLAEENNLSLDHLYYLPTYAAIAKFTTYPGIGVKTAACVSLFCMQRDCFAVDTHVFRLCKLLGWVPDQSALDYVKAKGEPRVDRDPTFSHLEVRMPDDLKYDLHQLFIAHGKHCPRCRGGASANSAGWEKGCPLDEVVDRTRLGKSEGKGRPAVEQQSAKLVGKTATAKKGKKKKRSSVAAAARDDDGLDEEESEAEMTDLVDDEEDDAMEEAMPDLDNDEEYKSPLKAIEGRRSRSSRGRL